MAGFLKYGTYSHDAADARFTISRRAQFAANGKRTGYTEAWNISGKLIAATQGALTTAINALESAYGEDRKDLKFMLDASTTSSHAMLTADSVSGTRVVEPVNYPEERLAQYVLSRDYSIVVEADFEVSKPEEMVSFTETLSYTGTGGEMWGLMPVQEGPWPRQTFATNTPMRIIQAGEAVGLTRYPVIPGPIFAGAEHEDQRQINMDGAQLVGNVYRNYRITWQYVFESPTGLGGTPNLQPKS